MSVPDRSVSGAPAPPLLSVHDDALFEVRLWPDLAWLELNRAQRPSEVEYVAGVGWVGAVRIRALSGQPPAEPRPDRRSSTPVPVAVERRSGIDRRRFDRMKQND